MAMWIVYVDSLSNRKSSQSIFLIICYYERQLQKWQDVLRFKSCYTYQLPPLPLVAV